MSLFDFADKHPWWLLVYLIFIMPFLPWIAICMKGFFNFSKMDHSKHGEYVDCDFKESLSCEDPSRKPGSLDDE